MSEALEQRKGRVLTGIVVSDKSDKTIVVRVQTLVKHPLFKKYVRRHKKFTAHDPMNACGIGDKVNCGVPSVVAQQTLAFGLHHRKSRIGYIHDPGRIYTPGGG